MVSEGMCFHEVCIVHLEIFCIVILIPSWRVCGGTYLMGSSLMWAARYSTSLLHIEESWTCNCICSSLIMAYNHVHCPSLSPDRWAHSRTLTYWCDQSAWPLVLFLKCYMDCNKHVSVPHVCYKAVGATKFKPSFDFTPTCCLNTSATGFGW